MAVPSIEWVQKRVPPIQGKKRKIKDWQTSDDILCAISDGLRLSPYCENYAYIFEQGNYTVEQTCEDLYNFMYDNFVFKAEPPEDQNSKEINVILESATNDCKHFSTFALGTLQALGIKSTLRICWYWDESGKMRKKPSHVYVIAYDENGDEIIVDGTLPIFNKESQAAKYKNINFKNMTLSHMSGEASIGKFSLSSLVKGVANDVKKVETGAAKAAKDVAKTVTNVVKTVEHDVALVAGAPARLAMSALIRANQFNIATMLAQAYQKNPQKVKDFWTGLGGDSKTFIKDINAGAHTSLSGSDYISPTDRIGDFISSPGALGDTQAAQASPIITAIISFLNAMGIPIPPVVGVAITNFLNGAKKVLAGANKVVTHLLPEANNVAPAAGIYKPGMSTGMKVGLAAAGIGVIFLATRKK